MVCCLMTVADPTTCLSWAQPVLEWALKAVSHLVLATNDLQRTACLLCLSSLNSKLTKTVVLAFVASSTVTMHFFIGCINIPHSFKFSTLIISLKDLLLCGGNGKCVAWCYFCHRGSAANTKSVWKTRKAAANSSVLWNMASYWWDIFTCSFFSLLHFPK